MSSVRPSMKPLCQLQSSTAIAPPIAPPWKTRPAPENSEPSTSPETSSQFSAIHHSRAPTRPPMIAAKMNSYAQSRGLPISSRYLAVSQPQTMKAIPSISPNVCRVRPKMFSSGCTSLRVRGRSAHFGVAARLQRLGKRSADLADVVEGDHPQQPRRAAARRRDYDQIDGLAGELAVQAEQELDAGAVDVLDAAEVDHQASRTVLADRRAQLGL